MVKYIVQLGMPHQGLSYCIIELTLLGDMLPSSDPGDTGGYHGPVLTNVCRIGEAHQLLPDMKMHDIA